MKSLHPLIALIATIPLVPHLGAQPFHNDNTVGGIQTLEVDGDVSVKQYGGGFGGNLKVEGDAHLAAGGISLPDMPAGVTGTYYGTQKIGPDLNVGEFVFTKNGDDTTGDFVVPLGVFGDYWNANIKLEIMTGPHDYDSGGAQFTIIPRRIPSMGGVIATDHVAVGGGAGVTIHAKNAGMMHLYLKYDANHQWGHLVRDHELRVKVSTIGSISPTLRWHTFEEMTPVVVMRSMVSNGWEGHHVLKGKVRLEDVQGDISMGIYE